jgi:hypothetical protein
MRIVILLTVFWCSILTACAQFVFPPFFGSTGHTGYEPWPTNYLDWPLWQATRAAHTNSVAIQEVFPDAPFSKFPTTQFRYSSLVTNRVEIPSTNIFVMTNVVITNFAWAGYWQASNSPVLVLSTNAGTNWISITNRTASLPALLAFTNGPGVVSNLDVHSWVWPLPIPTSANSTTWGRGAGMMRFDSNFLYIAVGINSWRRVALTNW